MTSLLSNYSYLSMLSDKELIEHARYAKSDEDSTSLTSLLAARLSEASVAVIREYKDEIADLECSLSEAENERDEAQDELADAEAEIEKLEAKLAELEAG